MTDNRSGSPSMRLGVLIALRKGHIPSGQHLSRGSKLCLPWGLRGGTPRGCYLQTEEKNVAS